MSLTSIIIMNTKNITNQKKIVLMMGAPGAGKSFIADREFPNMLKLDADDIKQTHPDYDPKHPEEVHLWSMKVYDEKAEKLFAGNETFLLDGTGANSDNLLGRVYQARENGFKVVLVYVVCSLKTAIKRNEERPRTIPEHVVISKHKSVKYSFEIVAPEVDEVKVFRND